MQHSLQGALVQCIGKFAQLEQLVDAFLGDILGPVGRATINVVDSSAVSTTTLIAFEEISNMQHNLSGELAHYFASKCEDKRIYARELVPLIRTIHMTTAVAAMTMSSLANALEDLAQGMGIADKDDDNDVDDGYDNRTPCIHAAFHLAHTWTENFYDILRSLGDETAAHAEGQQCITQYIRELPYRPYAGSSKSIVAIDWILWYIYGRCSGTFAPVIHMDAVLCTEEELSFVRAFILGVKDLGGTLMADDHLRALPHQHKAPSRSTILVTVDPNGVRGEGNVPPLRPPAAR